MNNIWKKYLFIIILFLVAIVFIFRSFNSITKNPNSNPEQNSYPSAQGLNRNIHHFILTKHALCRMDCRHITEHELEEILSSGKINYNKTNLNDDRGPAYAVEGYTQEHQHLRVVFAPKNDALVVVTCIDLDKEWQCNCN